MPKIDFLISNDRHHAAMIQPAVEALAARPRYQCRVVSLCEFRGLVSPVEQFQRIPGVAFMRVVPFQFRPSSSTGAQMGGGGTSRARKVARALSWYALLNYPMRRAMAAKPDLVVLPNDAAFPYNLITRQLRARHIPFVLVQEGIRFPLPSVSGDEVYGRGGATAVAAWGEASADYFRQVGVAGERICLVGNPRFDGICETDWQEQGQRLKQEVELGNRNLLFLSNPIDDQGFCTSAEKMALIGRFFQEIAPLFEDNDLHLIVKLHGRESVDGFQAVVNQLPYVERVKVLNAAPLYPLFTLSQAAIILASTVGLEALLFNLPLGVLEIPGVGFVYDYVSSGAALGLGWNGSMVEQVCRLLTSPVQDRLAAEQFVQRNFATRQGATGRLVDLITGLVEDDRGTGE
jgi:hypothetical protein